MMLIYTKVLCSFIQMYKRRCDSRADSMPTQPLQLSTQVTQALSCSAYFNLSFFLAERISITDNSPQIHVLVLLKINLLLAHFLNLLNCFHTFLLPAYSIWHFCQFRSQSNSYPVSCLFWIINEDNT